MLKAQRPRFKLLKMRFYKAIMSHHHFNYIELPAIDLPAMKAFYSQVFGWNFIDYGPRYTAISGAGIDGGFDADADRVPSSDGVLVVLYSDDLEATEKAVKSAGAEICVAIFSFPGGRRFHFTDPSGNVLGVWTQSDAAKAG